MFDGANSVSADLGAVVNLGAINTSGITKPLAGWLTYGGGGPIPAVVGNYIDSYSSPALSWVGSTPASAAGDLLVAMIMSRAGGGGLSTPAGWSVQGVYLGNLLVSGTDAQTITVYTKTSTASEPATVTWTQPTSSRICGMMTTVRGGTINTVTQSYDTGATVTLNNTGSDFYLNASTWIYATTVGTVYALTGPGITEISDSPNDQARIGGGYTSQDGIVTMTKDSAGETDPPNIGMISIGFNATGGGGGSSRPTSGFLYPRGQG
jgi:hypothetical protein